MNTFLAVSSVKYDFFGDRSTRFLSVIQVEVLG